MGFFSDIKDKIFNRHHEAVTPVAPTTAPKANPGQAAAPAAPQSSGSPSQPNSPAPAVGTTATAPASTVDVAVILDQAVKENGQTLHWRTSIVDLMKALGIDSSLTARKELAKELNYSGDTEDSAAMNVWLHKQVLHKLAENGGKVPADLLD